MRETHRINILFTNASYYSLDREIGGGEVHLLSLVSRLSREKYDIFVAYPGAGPFEDALKERQVTALRVKSLRGKWELFGVPAIMSLIRKYDIQIVHAYEPKSAFMAMVAAHLFKVPAKILTVHLPFFSPFWKETGLAYVRDKIRSLRDTLASQIADKTIAVSEEIRREKIERQRIPFRKVAKILNGVDCDKFVPDTEPVGYLREKFNIPKALHLIGVVALLEPRKGHVFLIRAMGQVIYTVPDVRLLVIGEGWYEKELREAVREHGLEELVIFTGFQKNMPKVLCDLDVVVLPSLYESTNLSLIEAMLLETPVIASAIPSHVDMINNGDNGLLVPPKDPKALADALVSVFEDSQCARDMGKRGRLVALERFSLARMAAETENVYSQVLGEKVSN